MTGKPVSCQTEAIRMGNKEEDGEHLWRILNLGDIV